MGVIVADEVELAVRRAHVPRRGAVAAPVLEPVVALATLHTQRLRQGGRAASVPVRVKASKPRLARSASFGRDEEVLEGDVEQGASGLGEQLATLPVAELGIDVETPASAAGQPRGDGELAVDGHRLAVANEHAGGHRREAVPGREEPAGLVESRCDEAAVDDAGACLVTRAEGESGLVALDPLLDRLGEADALRIVPAAPAERVVMRGDPRYRSPPRSKCAR